MCSPFIIAEVDRIVAGRRRFLKTAAGSCAAAAGLGGISNAASAQSAPTSRPKMTFSRTVDLTHTLTPDFRNGSRRGMRSWGRPRPPVWRWMTYA